MTAPLSTVFPASSAALIERETRRARLFILLAITEKATSSLSELRARMGED